ncbi:glycosyltransferase family 4 protein [Citrobacter portucalensis]|uniref:glycosyltransferase family 4 protein n=1 Tax=Citrobacter portucalensis TaxID=1639133 RepID=UPI0028BFBC10|nr:glycosyltransferase family 4 protein [Citrobacter portucalensis]
MENKRKKVLHLQLLPLLSGVQRVTLNEINQLHDFFDYTVACSTPGPLTDSVAKMNVKVHFISELCRKISFGKDIVAIYKLYKFIRVNKFDVVHTHSSKTGIIGRVAAKLARVPNIIHTVHGFSFPAATNKKNYLLYYFLEWVARFFTDKLIVLNKEDQLIAIKKLNYNKDKVYLIPNGVDENEFHPNQNKKNENELKIVMVGRLSKQKDPETLLLAVKKVLVRNKNVTLSFVGDGELRTQLERQIMDKDNRIFFHGWMNNISEILAKSDLFVLPSLWEGMPLAILEALSCGLPCIVTNIPGNNSLIHDGYNGRLFEVGDVDTLAALISIYADDRDLLKKHSLNARAFIINGYTLSKRNECVKQLYDY